MLQILSCFGIQTDSPLLKILDKFQNGISWSIISFVELGILDVGGTIIIFNHDLIKQAVYESMSLDQRRVLHLDIGTFLGETACKDATLIVANHMSDLKISDQSFYLGKSITSLLICIACDQINLAGPEAVSDEIQQLKFAE